MGIDIHALNFLLYVKTLRDLDETITLGRQEIYVIEPLLRKAVNADSKYKNDAYCEQLLQDYLGANTVDSMDFSRYENASIIHDMNQPLPSDVQSKYDTVIDGGFLEHIYDIPQALKNCSLLCKPGGQILHILPANNYCGHGFWQFSPELFFSLYSDENGYQDTEVFLVKFSNARKWFKVKPPRNGRRVEVHSSTALSVLVRTVLKGADFSHDNVQQSDYVHEWTDSSTKAAREITSQNLNRIKKFIKQSQLFYALLSPPYSYYLRMKKATVSRLSNSNPNLVEINVASLLKSN